MEPLLHLRAIRHLYNDLPVLDIPDLHFAAGSITGLAGPNGSGKSTLLRIMSLAEHATAGTVHVAGAPVRPQTGSSAHGITLLPQEAYLLRRTVFDNIAYGLRLRKGDRDLQEAVAEGLTLVGLAPSFATRKWHELSGGEAQRVALAARLVLRPACLLLDEPTASVDLKSGLLIRQAVLHAREQWGTTLVIASHQRTWLHDICDRILYLYNGRLLDCSPDNLLPGPWERSNGKEWFSRLADGQLLYAHCPPSPESNGVLPPTGLRLSSEAPAAGEYLLRGRVNGLYVDKHLRGTCIMADCGGLPLLATAAMEGFTADACRPGQEIELRYRPDSIIWLN